MKLKKISAIFSVVIIAALVTVYYTSVGFTEVQSNSAKLVLTDSAITNSVYTCPMHSDVISDKPGKCPKCGMDLELKSDKDNSQGMNMMNGMDRCKDMGCNMENCKGKEGGCSNCTGSNGDCKMMKDGMNKDCMNKSMSKDGKCKMNCNGK